VKEIAAALPPDRSVVVDVDIDDDDNVDSVIEIARPNATATAKNKPPANASKQDDDSENEVVEVKPAQLTVKPPPSGAAGRAPPASTTSVMKATTTGGTAPPVVAPTSSIPEKLAILRSFVEASFTDQQLADCLKECCYDVPWAAGVLKNRMAAPGPSQGRGGKSRSSSKPKFPLANWTNRFDYLCSKANGKPEGGAPAASSFSAGTDISAAAAAPGNLPLLAMVR
jgi:hypothetical protein